MEDISVLSKQILSRIEAEGQSKLSNYQKKADQEISNLRQNIEAKEKQYKEAIKLKLNNDYERDIQTIANQQRNHILAKKQELLNGVFEQALVELENWDQKQFSDFISGVLNKIDNNKGWTLIFGERSKDMIEADQVKSVLNKYSFVNLSDQVVNNKAGFILEQGGIDYNFTFDAIVTELKKEFSPQLATLAFQNNE